MSAPRALSIAIPAWGAEYVALAVRYTVPAILASLRESEFRDVSFRIWTDDRSAFAAALDGFPVDFRPAPARLARPAQRQRLRDKQWMATWGAFMQAHRDAIELTPPGAIVALFNADIVCSRETFAVVGRALAPDSGKKTVVSVGIRTLIDGNVPPVGVDAQTLNRWIWQHPHPITQECIWGRGGSKHPTLIFFQDGDSVAMHGFHLTPMFIVREPRALQFNGTIDDDLLKHYADDDIHYVRDAACAFAELSARWKTHPAGVPLSVDAVLNFGERRLSKAHVRNFGQRLAVLGDPQADHPAAAAIKARLTGH